MRHFGLSNIFSRAASVTSRQVSMVANRYNISADKCLKTFYTTASLGTKGTLLYGSILEDNYYRMVVIPIGVIAVGIFWLRNQSDSPPEGKNFSRKLVNSLISPVRRGYYYTISWQFTGSILGMAGNVHWGFFGMHGHPPRPEQFIHGLTAVARDTLTLWMAFHNASNHNTSNMPKDNNWTEANTDLNKHDKGILRRAFNAAKNGIRKVPKIAMSLTKNPWFTYGCAFTASGTLLTEGIRVSLQGSDGSAYILTGALFATARTVLEAVYYFAVERNNVRRNALNNKSANHGAVRSDEHNRPS